ncbi:MAG: class I SAM-dependent methyltransferase [Eubacteriales bacterium]|nr:class I SAM-dependent methyltransferase [Eubacteriales bacterium]MDD3881556.1 class I SAM-dependent methyltransferase [Eubacteriales bacterium]MDD4513374.1 class I SAM-dependent methyltransferase [Eubacteriales bacterium]
MKNSAVRLDNRLRAAAFYMRSCKYAADIGSDHGYLSLFLLESNPNMRMVVSDISAESLLKARVNLKNVSDRAEFIVADGLNAIEKPVECAAICGMGGELIARIMESGAERLSGAALVLSPNTEPELVREAVCRIGYHIEDEKVACAAGRLYVIIYAKKGAEECAERDIYIGTKLQLNCDELTRRYYSWRREVVKTALDETSKAVKQNAKRIALYKKRYEWLCEAIERLSKESGGLA